MALKRGTSTGGDFLDLKELDDNTLVVFRIREYRNPEPAQGFEGTNYPVIADSFIASGPRKGEVWTDQKFFGSITHALRGVRNPKKGEEHKLQPPAHSVGDELAFRIKVLNRGKSNAGAVGDEPSDPEYAVVEQAYAAAGGETLWASVPTSATAVTNGVPVGAGAGGATADRPWG